MTFRRAQAQGAEQLDGAILVGRRERTDRVPHHLRVRREDPFDDPAARGRQG